LCHLYPQRRSLAPNGKTSHRSRIPALPIA
jgi:hypothetical protein